MLLQNGVEIQIYKSHIYIHDPLYMKNENEEKDAMYNGISCTVYYGDLSYNGVDIEVMDESQPVEAVYVIASFCDIKGKDSSSWEYYEFVGIGTYGFAGEEYVGVREIQIKRLKEMIQKKGLRYPIEGCERYNLGDAYFAENLFGESVDSVQTRCGLQEEPFFLSALKGSSKNTKIKKSNKDD